MGKRGCLLQRLYLEKIIRTLSALNSIGLGERLGPDQNGVPLEVTYIHKLSITTKIQKYLPHPWES